MVKPTIFLVSGSWHGPESYCLVTPFLEQAGYSLASVRLPSTLTTPGKAATWEDDCTILRTHITSVEGSVVVVCHSYAGAVVTESLKGLESKVKAIVYLCAYMLQEGEAIYTSDSSSNTENSPWDLVDVQGDVGYLKNPRETIYKGFPEDFTNKMIGQLGAQSLSVFRSSVSYAAWKHIPSTYVICTEDKTIPPSLQEKFASRSAEGKNGHVEVVRLKTDHWPVLWKPEETAAIIVRAVEQ